MANSRYYRCDEEENRNQWYWGAFMLGRAAFYRHHGAGYWLTDEAVDALGVNHLAAIDTSAEGYGQAGESFADGFRDGYRRQGNQMGREGLQLLPGIPDPAIED